MNNILWQILLQVLLIGLNAIFACAEIAVLSVNETKLERMAADGNRKAARLRKLTVQAPGSWRRFKWPSPCPASWAAPSRRIIFRSCW